MSSNNTLIDNLTLRQILIERYSKGESKRLLKHLKRLSAKLKTTVENDYGRVRAVRLAQQASKITETILTEYGDDMDSGLREFAKVESEFAQQVLLDTTAAEVISTPSIRQILAAITKKKMKLIVGKKFQEFTISQASKAFSKKRAIEVANIIKDGATTGKTTQQLTKEIFDLVGTRTRRQAEALVRTSTNHIGNIARDATYRANDDVVDGWGFVATLDSSTTLICAGFDGETFKLGEGPSLPLHWGERSIAAPRVNPKYDLGSEIVGERASIDGPVSGQTTYGGFLKRQSSAVQDEVLGPSRAKLFRSGKLSIKKFTDDSGKVYNLKQLRRLNPLAFESASGT